MNPPPLELSPFAARSFGEARCRRYLFDRPDALDPPPPVDALASSGGAPKPPPAGWEDGQERAS